MLKYDFRASVDWERTGIGVSLGGLEAKDNSGLNPPINAWNQQRLNIKKSFPECANCTAPKQKSRLPEEVNIATVL